MPSLPELSAVEVLKALDEHREQLSQAVNTVLQRPVQMDEASSVETPTTDAAPAHWHRRGLLITAASQQQAAWLWIPDTDGWLPSWIAEPNQEQSGKLDQLADQLARQALGSISLDAVTCQFVKDLSAVYQGSQPSHDARTVRIPWQYDNTHIHVELVWPIAAPAPQPKNTGKRSGKLTTRSREPIDPSELAQRLPGYCRSLLRIQVPVSVTLATTRQRLSRILELGPGSIIQFEKSCEETLTLAVGQQTIAEGEAVKVGEKFGLRLSSIVLPKERLKAIEASLDDEAASDEG